jgi:hypothetical protein
MATAPRLAAVQRRKASVNGATSGIVERPKIRFEEKNSGVRIITASGTKREAPVAPDNRETLVMALQTGLHSGKRDFSPVACNLNAIAAGDAGIVNRERGFAMARTCLAVVLAAGDATRMKSTRSKVLHSVGNLPLIAHVTGAAAQAGVNGIALVVGRDADEVTRAARRGHDVPVTPVMQTERKGTGHAVLMAQDIIAQGLR